MGGPMFPVFTGSEHKKEAWNLSGFYKKSQILMQRAKS